MLCLIKYHVGPDSIPSILLKISLIYISLPLSIIFQKSFNLGKLPNLWKIEFNSSAIYNVISQAIPNINNAITKKEFSNI